MDFKPNLIPNFKGQVDPIDQLREKLVGKDLSRYIISYKKDGCRLELLHGRVLTRELKPVQNLHLANRLKKFAEYLNSHGIVAEGEFYDHDMSFEEIKRFFKTHDVTDPKHLKKFTKLEAQGRLGESWPGRTPEWLTTNHDSLKMWIFDCYFIKYPDMGYKNRMYALRDILKQDDAREFWPLFKFEPSFLTPHGITTVDELISLYKDVLEDGWEGLILSDANRLYKMNRSTLREETFFKLKEDRLNYIGEVVDVVEATEAIPGAPKTKNNLGRSVTSKLQEHRQPSGMAKGFVTLFEGEEHIVSLKGFDHSARRELLENKDKYIGKGFSYTGMKPTKKMPRHSQFNYWY